MRKNQLKEIIKKSLKEISATGTGASTSTGSGEGVATKYAFKKKTNEVKVVNPKKDIMNLFQEKVNIQNVYKIIEICKKYMQIPFSGGNIGKNPLPMMYNIVKKGVENMSPEKVTEFYTDLLHIDQKQQVAEGYTNFKKQVTTKTPRSSSQAAMRVVKRKLREINKTLDYSSKLREELGESVKLKEENLNEILLMVNEINKKLKKLYK